MPDQWPTLGARVAEYDRGATVNIVRVERLTATQIIVEGSDRRYRRDNLKAVGDPYGYQLRPLTDADVVAARARAALSGVASQAETVCRRVTDGADGYGPSGYGAGTRLYGTEAAQTFRAAIAEIRDLAAAALEDLDDVDEHPRDAEAVLRQLAAALISTGCSDQASSATGLAVALRDGILKPVEAAQHLRALLGPAAAVDAAHAAAARLDQLGETSR
jgi:hypothetical protein